MPFAFPDEDLLGMNFAMEVEGILSEEPHFGSIFSPVRNMMGSPKLGQLLGQTYGGYQYNAGSYSPFNSKGALSPGFVRRSTRLTPGHMAMTPGYTGHTISISPSPFKLPADMTGLSSPSHDNAWLRQAAVHPPRQSHAKRPLLPQEDAHAPLSASTPSPVSKFSPDSRSMKKEKRIFQQAIDRKEKKERKDRRTTTAPKRGEYRCGKCGHFPKKDKHVCNKERQTEGSPESSSLDRSLYSPDSSMLSQESASDQKSLSHSLTGALGNMWA